VSIAEPPPTDTKPSTFAVQREVGGLLQGVDRRLHARAVVRDDRDALGLDRLPDAVGMAGRGDAGVGDQQRPPHPEALELPAGVGHRAGAELDRRGLQREHGLAAHRALAWHTMSLVDALRAVVGERQLLVDADVRAPFEVDWTRRFRGAPPRSSGPARPTRSSPCCGRARSMARRSSPRAATPGSLEARCRAAVRSSSLLTRLTGLGQVDRASLQVDAGAGVTLAALQGRARAAGLDAGVDFAARDSATVGGLVACDAGGVRAVRHGTVRARVAGLEAVLADGSIVSGRPGCSRTTPGMTCPACWWAARARSA
jgi:hypothetical protein